MAHSVQCQVRSSFTEDHGDTLGYGPQLLPECSYKGKLTGNTPISVTSHLEHTLHAVAITDALNSNPNLGVVFVDFHKLWRTLHLPQLSGSSTGNGTIEHQWKVLTWNTTIEQQRKVMMWNVTIEHQWKAMTRNATTEHQWEAMSWNATIEHQWKVMTSNHISCGIWKTLTYINVLHKIIVFFSITLSMSCIR